MYIFEKLKSMFASGNSKNPDNGERSEKYASAFLCAFEAFLKELGEYDQCRDGQIVVSRGADDSPYGRILGHLEDLSRESIFDLIPEDYRFILDMDFGNVVDLGAIVLKALGKGSTGEVVMKYSGKALEYIQDYID